MASPTHTSAAASSDDATSDAATVVAPIPSPRPGGPADVPTHGPSRRGVARALLAVLVALALLAGLLTATALSAPSLARSLGLPLDVPTGPAPEPTVPRPRLTAAPADAPQPTADGVAAALDDRLDGLGDLTGVVVDPAVGTGLWSRGPQDPQVPASSTKLLTTAASLLVLDPAGRFTTSVVAGPTPDSVVVVGGGDPTLSSLPDGEESVYSGAAHLDDLVAQVRAARAGAPALRTVYLDLSRYDGPTLAAGWDPVDIAGGNLAPMVPTMLDGGRLVPTEVDGARTATPAQTLGGELARRLGAPGAQVTLGSAPTAAAPLGSVASPPTTELVRLALQNSDNVLAEALGREVARRTGRPATFAGAAEAVTGVLAERGIDVAGVTLSDTSGLSTADRIPASALASVLTTAAGPDTGTASAGAASSASSASSGSPASPAALRPVLDGLPVAGGVGTLADRFGTATTGAPARGWVRAKTGTLTGTSALAGIVTDVDGRVLVFAFMSNGSDVLGARPRLDALTAALRACGCR